MKKLNALILASLSLVLAACVNLEPDPDMSQSFALGPVSVSSSSDSDVGSIHVMRPLLPGYLDSNRIQYRDANGLVDAIEDAFWAEPLAEGVARGFAQFYGQNTSFSEVSHYPWPELGSEASKLDLRFHHLSATADGAVQVEVSWTVRAAGGDRKTGRFAAPNLTWEFGDPASLVAAYNEALRLLASEVSESL